MRKAVFCRDPKCAEDAEVNATANMAAKAITAKDAGSEAGRGISKVMAMEGASVVECGCSIPAA
jgi:hypothetical protein